ncbi:hypothetical protein PAHAL_5G124000 [Panicum hallii]|uniref:Uncharacterized protein n=1 Tax=Panicum hallii TaxID=206008 RepID=A0A2S3HQU8_9POAL|nr:hypothetical protein PAHAL_5G124000 [Panicum hallii]
MAVSMSSPPGPRGALACLLIRSQCRRRSEFEHGFFVPGHKLRGDSPPPSTPLQPAVALLLHGVDGESPSGSAPPSPVSSMAVQSSSPPRGADRPPFVHLLRGVRRAPKCAVLACLYRASTYAMA